MITYVLPLEKSALNIAFGAQRLKCRSFKEIIIGDPSLSQTLIYILIVTFDSVADFNNWKTSLSALTDRIIKSQDDRAMDDGSFFSAMGLLITLESNNEDTNSESHLLQVPKDKLKCLEYLNGISRNFTDNSELASHFEGGADDINPNFSVIPCLIESDEEILQLEDENEFEQKAYKKEIGEHPEESNKSLNLEIPRQEPNQKSSLVSTKINLASKLKYLGIAFLWLGLLWNFFFKYLDNVSATVAVILLTIAGITLADKGSRKP